MTGLTLQTGSPPIEGRYVVFATCVSRQCRDFCEPHIATWHGNRWHFGETVWAWIGPLPVVNNALLATLGQEFDL